MIVFSEVSLRCSILTSDGQYNTSQGNTNQSLKTLYPCGGGEISACPGFAQNEYLHNAGGLLQRFSARAERPYVLACITQRHRYAMRPVTETVRGAAVNAHWSVAR